MSRLKDMTGLKCGMSHPDFIPGTPEDCGACAREAKDEGRRW